MLSVLTRPQSQYAWAIFLAVGTVPEQRQLDSGGRTHRNTALNLEPPSRVPRAAGRANAAGGSRWEQRSRRSVERKPGPTCQTGEVGLACAGGRAMNRESSSATSPTKKTKEEGRYKFNQSAACRCAWGRDGHWAHPSQEYAHIHDLVCSGMVARQ
jgi:hypothetical protein